MPLEQHIDDKNIATGIWRITEDEATLSNESLWKEEIPAAIRHEKKRMEFLAARLLLEKLMQGWNLEYSGIIKNEFGKPFFNHHNVEMSLTHSFPYVAAIIGKTQPVGIDLEQPKEKLLKIAPRVLHPDELADAGTEVVKHCIYWCAKETLIKFHGKKDLSLTKGLLIDPFSHHKKGVLIGRIVANDITTVPMQYEVYDNFVIVHST